MDASQRIEAAARSLLSLAPAVSGLEAIESEREIIGAAAERGHFTPDESARLRAWFARYLTARGELLQTIVDLKPLAMSPQETIPEALRCRAFLVGYAAACVLVRAGRFLVSEVATNSVVQRKLNEAAPEHRIPRKQFTSIYKSLTSPNNAWQLREAMHFADTHREELLDVATDPLLDRILPFLEAAEDSIRLGVRQYVRARLRYRWHSWRRRRASAAQRVLFRLCQGSGRLIAEVRNPLHRKRITPGILRRIDALLNPGDVLITRHHDALSNLFLPGYWPHAALHVGPSDVREQWGIEVDADRAQRWVHPRRVLEARKDGVLLRALDDTLSVDAVVVLRPQVDERAIARAIAQGLAHEGKLYNFDFDFFTDDRLVCTEVVYRSFTGIEGVAFELRKRAGRVTLSAEDLIDMALRDRGFAPALVFGAPGCRKHLARDDEARTVLRKQRESEPSAD